jgi:Cd2+/Zn2+-exporting ATPase
LIKGGAYLEEMGDISVIAFDKTGTLTRGEAEVTDFITLSGDEKVVLSLASAIESRSEHPLARAIVNYAQKQSVSAMAIENFQAVPGQGAYADLAGKRYYIGNLRLFENQPCSLREEEKQTIEKLQNEGKTVMLLGDEQNLLAMLAVADTLRENSVQQISLLKRMGMDKIIMLTGDNERTARAIASKVGVDEFQAGLLPADKLKVIKDLLAQNYKVAMVGDGVNDAPALALATVGIAMGAAGTDTALETADIALMADDLSKVAYTIQLGRRSLAIIKQNIAFSLLIKAAILLLVIPGWLTLWLAVLGDMGTSLLVTLNGMRLLRSQRL